MLRLLLRVIGTFVLLALPCVFMPEAWMKAIHAWLDMGELPGDPVVGYLARTTSALYAMLGGLMWIVSFDLRGHRPILGYLGMVFISMGIILFGVDIAEGMPLWWSIKEGLFNVGFGAAILVLCRRIDKEQPDA